VSVAERLVEVRARIEAAGGDLDRVRVVAVTKGFGADAVEEALAAGLPDVGENYAQELVAKAQQVEGARWQFLGRIQRRKVRLLGTLVHRWHSVDRAEVGVEIAKHAPGARVLVQVAAWGEPQKGGVPPEATAPLVTQLVDLGLQVEGLMGIAPAGAGETARAGFATVRALADGLDLRECSMGMTDDFELAVQEGATLLRLGRVLFGPRSGAATVRN
jgi:pyridoxal phosphate enzyme (YggS family)